MPFSESQPKVSHIAETTFAKTDLYKFVSLSTTNGRVVIAGSTGGRAYGTLLSETYSTSTGANEAVTVGLLQGIGKVFMAGSTSHAGNRVAASSKGYGIALTTDTIQIGTVVEGSSGTTGRIHSVAFGIDYNL
jgi:hypothetical protein